MTVRNAGRSCITTKVRYDSRSLHNWAETVYVVLLDSLAGARCPVPLLSETAVNFGGFVW